MLLALILGLVIILRSPTARSAKIETAGAPNTVSSPVEPAEERRDAASGGAIREAALSSEAGADVALLVRLVHPDGQPAEAWCTFHPADGSRIWTRSSHGVGVLLGVRPGPAQFRISGRGYYSRVEDVMVAAAPAEQEIRLIAEPSARIAVRFMAPDGRRLIEVLKESLPAHQAYGVLPSLFAMRQGNLPEFTPRGDYYYQSPDAMWSTSQELVNLPDDLDGELSLMTPPPMMLHALLRHRAVGMQALEAPAESLDFVVDPERLLAELGTIRVRLLDGTTGEPFASGISNHVNLTGASSIRPFPRTDEGSFLMEGLPPGAYLLSASAMDRASLRQFVLLDPGAEYDAGELRLPLPASAKLRLFDPEGMPISDALVLALDVRGLSNLFMVGQSSHKTNAAGEVEVGRKESVEHLFSFVPPMESKAGAGYMRLTPSITAGTTHDVRLQPGIPVKLSGMGQDLLQLGMWIMLDGLAPVPIGRYANLPSTILLPPGMHAWMLTDAAGREVKRGALLVAGDMTELQVEVPLP